MMFDSKYRKALIESKDAKIGGYIFAPPMYQLLMKYGVKIIPPLYCPLVKNTMVYGCVFYILFSAFQIALYQFLEGPAVLYIMRNNVVIGLLFGIMIAVYYKILHKYKGLTKWGEL